MNQTGDATLRYGAALSPWPGRVYVRGFLLSVHDSHVQMQIESNYVQGSISITDLFFKEMHVRNARAKALRFRIRAVRDAGTLTSTELSRLPEIFGCSSPFRTPSMIASVTPDDLWTARVDQLSAPLSEIWIEEQHYTGSASLEGGFYYKPLRALGISDSRFKAQQRQGNDWETAIHRGSVIESAWTTRAHRFHA
ncbi:MAG: hypothetical protein IPJ88_07640 [Myxococcales bacterium]|nr:MAG: hypothetical protein IPJ88_07640 [Myxococcales bacterium]